MTGTQMLTLSKKIMPQDGDHRVSEHVLVKYDVDVNVLGERAVLMTCFL